MDLDAIVDTVTAARFAGVQDCRVRRWAVSYPDLLPVRERDRRGRPRYRLADVVAVEKATRLGARLTA